MTKFSNTKQVSVHSNAAAENVKNHQSISNERIQAFDLARGIAIVAMVIIHTVVFLGNPELMKTIPGYIINSIVCIFAAPVFTFIMGVMIVFSSKSSLRTMFIRGLVLLCIGYLLNFLRGTLPIAFGEWAGLIDFQDERPWAYMLEQDILQFAGIAFIVIAVVKRMVRWNIGLVITGGIIIIAAPLLYQIHIDEGVAGFVVSLLFGGNQYNFFPVVPWIAFPLVGIWYGELLKKTKDKFEFVKISLITGAFLLVLGVSLSYYFDRSIFQQWYNGKFRQGQLPPLVSLLFIGFQFVWIPVCYFITKKIRNSRVLNILYKWSSNVTRFYVIQWVIIGWACIFLPWLNWTEVLFAIALLFVITDRVMISFVKKQRR
jgi:uncharacterized membrane protein